MLSNTLDVETGHLETYRAVQHADFASQAAIKLDLQPNVAQPSHAVNMLEMLTPHLARLGLPVNADFLMGQYIVSLMQPLPTSLKSFHGGMTSDALLRGIYQGLKVKWNFYGCDVAHSNKNRYIGDHVDVFNVNAARATCAAAGYGTFDFCVMDVRPRGARDLLVSSLFARVVKPHGLVVLRMPDNPADCLDIVAFLALTHDAQIFKSPFALKYYLFLRSKKIYPEAFVFNYLSIEPRPAIVLGDLDELKYNFEALIKYNPVFNPDEVLTWYMKHINV